MDAPSPMPSSPAPSPHAPPAPPPRAAQTHWSRQLIPFVPLAVAVAVAVGATFYHKSHPAAPGGEANGEVLPPAAGPKVGDVAPDFTLPDAHGGTVTLSQLTEKGPVLVVFYLAYTCPRCISHLLELDEQRGSFEKLGVRVVAISPSTITEARDSIEQYGDLTFPMLSDETLKVSRAYGLTDGNTLFHGTFAVDGSRRIRLAEVSSHPFYDIETLLQTFEEMSAK